MVAPSDKTLSQCHLGPALTVSGPNNILITQMWWKVAVIVDVQTGPSLINVSSGLYWSGLEGCIDWRGLRCTHTLSVYHLL